MPDLDSEIITAAAEAEPAPTQADSARLRELKRSSYLSLVPVFGWAQIKDALRRLGLEEPK